MEVLHYGIDFPHEKGRFCTRSVFDYYVICCFSTPFLYERNQELLRGEAGELLITPPGSVVYHGPIVKEEAFVNDWIYIEGNAFGELLKRYPIPENQAFSIGNPKFLKNVIEKIQDEQLLKHVGFEDMVICCLTETIINIHRLYQRQRQTHSSVSRIESAREMVMRHLQKDWNLSDMAALCDYSVSRFSTLYYQRFGCSPKADLLFQRMELAKQMLRYSELSITEIADRCGFKSIYYFSRYFKEATGVAPSDYALNDKKSQEC